MNTFGVGGWMVCSLIAAVIAAFTIGLTKALFAIVVLLYGYVWLLNAANSAFYPDGSLRPRGRRRGQRRSGGN